MVMLQKGENILMQDPATSDDWGKGTLYLTSYRVVFETKTGLLAAKTELAMDYSLEKIQNVSTHGLIGKKLRIELYAGERGTGGTHDFSVKNQAQWEQGIKSAVQSA